MRIDSLGTLLIYAGGIAVILLIVGIIMLTRKEEKEEKPASNSEKQPQTSQLNLILDNPQSEPTQLTKKCPYCAEEIKFEAIVCRYCGRNLSSGLPINAPATTNNGLDTIEVMMVVLLVILGLYWLGIGLTQLLVTGSGFDATGGWLFLTAIWNIGISIFNLYYIRVVVKHQKKAVSGLTSLAVVGSLWGVAMVFLFAASVQICAVPLYIALGILVQINKHRFIAA